MCSFCHWYVPCGKIYSTVFYSTVSMLCVVCVLFFFHSCSSLCALYAFFFILLAYTGWKVKCAVFGCCRHIYIYLSQTHSFYFVCEMLCCWKYYTKKKSFFSPFGLICHHQSHIYIYIYIYFQDACCVRSVHIYFNTFWRLLSAWILHFL